MINDARQLLLELLVHGNLVDTDLLPRGRYLFQLVLIYMLESGVEARLGRGISSLGDQFDS